MGLFHGTVWQICWVSPVRTLVIAVGQELLSF
jgi:hypothetical protein